MTKSVQAYFINPDILKWARITCGFTLERISEKFNWSSERLENIEKGKEKITMSQLRKLAQIYKRPISIFYLDEIPAELELPDFRKHPIDPIVVNTNDSINIKLREIYEKRKYAITLKDLNNLDFNYDYLTDLRKFIQNSDKLSIKIREFLNVDTKNFDGKRDYQVFHYWRNKIEEKNILVFQFQGIGNDIIRGFVFSEFPFPTIALNQKETNYAKIFTLIHEFCHIILNESGKCDADALMEESENVESKCNFITSSVLTPKNEIIKEFNLISKENIEIIISKLSKHFHVSWSVILYRLNGLNLIEHHQYLKMKKLIEKKREAYKNKERKGGANYYRTFLAKNSHNYLKLLYSSLDRNIIRYSQALQFSGQKFKTFQSTKKKFIDWGYYM